MLLKEFISKAVAVLEQTCALDEARAIVFALCEDVIGTKSYTHIIEPDYKVPEASLPGLEEKLSRLEAGEPLQYVTGHCSFCGFDFKVSPDVLIPRQETELLCRHAIDFVSRIMRMRSSAGKFAVPVRILDLCTGSGCIAWTLALSVPGVEVVAVDNSEKALQVAATQPFREYARKHNINVPQFICQDILSPGFGSDLGVFSLITSNPPYVRESEKACMNKNVLGYEPASALFVPDDDPLLYYRAVASISMRCLEDEGMGFTEINEAFGPATAGIFTEGGFARTEVIKDISNRNRIVRYSR